MRQAVLLLVLLSSSFGGGGGRGGDGGGGDCAVARGHGLVNTLRFPVCRHCAPPAPSPHWCCCQAKLANISLSELNPAVQNAQGSSSGGSGGGGGGGGGGSLLASTSGDTETLRQLQQQQQQQQHQHPHPHQGQHQQQQQQPNAGASHWTEIRRSWQVAMDEGVKIRICDGCLEDTQVDLMECWDSLSIKPQVGGQQQSFGRGAAMYTWLIG